ncbi:S8/S53 family peptidase [Spongiactinospora sp. TRM90649]|uniref:S8 family peptidase n=1 Tax=Spongiactinospora sp. TRM90649 TaxID=3031114 RepID=UPI0023F90AA6|nr:S8/S53 family peptidase [Spongiactinospora sp. TRM90649]MDF5756969.1 S8/S53 family peptidase [Spongiactinospora sp. TRM90649]
MATQLNGIVRRDTEAFHGARVVVDLKDESLLEKELTDLHIATVSRDESEPLGLAMRELHGLEAAMEGLANRTELVGLARREGEGTYSADDDLTPLDMLLFYIRRKYAASHSGWRPTLAKERFYENPEGSPYSGGNTGNPRALKAGETFALPRRAESDRTPIRIGVIDTPLFAHQDLAGRYLAAHDGLLARTPDWVSFGGHCLLVCSLAAEQAPDAELVVRPVLDPATLTTTSWALAKEMVEAQNDELDILVMALGGPTADGEEPLVLARACERTPALVKVAAIGNHGRPDDWWSGAFVGDEANRSPLEPTVPMWPSASPSVIGVGALNEEGGRAFFSPSMEEAPWTDCMAPGTNRRGLFLPGDVEMVRMNYDSGTVERTGEITDFGLGYAEWDGTSFATAHVGGAIAGIAQRRGVSAKEAARLYLAGG